MLPSSGTDYNYATNKPVYMTDDVTRSGASSPVSASTVDDNVGTCPDRMQAV